MRENRGKAKPTKLTKNDFTGLKQSEVRITAVARQPENLKFNKEMDIGREDFQD